MARIRRTGARVSGANDVSSLPRPFGVLLDEADPIHRITYVDRPLPPVYLSPRERAEGLRRLPPASSRRLVRFMWRSPVEVRRTRLFDLPYGLSIRAPLKVRFCLRRKERREVLFAKRKVGYRGSSPGPYRRTANSQWRC